MSEPFVTTCSTGRRKKGIAAGDQILMLQQGSAYGIVASGTALEAIWTDDTGTNWVDVVWDAWVPNEERLGREELRRIAPRFQKPVQTSGERLADDQARAVMSAWDALHPPAALRGNDAPSGDEAGVVAPDGELVEGASEWIPVLR